MVSFQGEIKLLFRQHDRRAMLQSFDLWDHQDVQENALSILQRLDTGDMPCDGPWLRSRLSCSGGGSMGGWLPEPRS